MGQPDADSTGGWNGHVNGAAPWTEVDAPPPGRRTVGRRRAKQPGMMGDIAGGARNLGQRVKRAPAKVRIAAAAGVLVVLALAGTLVLTGVFSGPDGAGAAPGPSAGTTAEPASKALYSGVKKVSHRGITVNVPADWSKSTAGSYADFVEGDRKVRINVEPAGTSSESFFRAAEAQLKKKPDICPAYQRVALRDIAMGGHDGSELEYTCGEGDQQRHGLWAAVVQGGKAYEFFLSVPEPELADSKVIYQEMVRSFTLTAS
jgi:hypothetical protein